MQEWTPTPPDILPHIADMLSKQHTTLLDPCAGDGSTLDYLARKWNCSRHAVEIDPTLAEIASNNAVIQKEAFQNVYARGFGIVYAFPPTDMTNPVEWIRMVKEAVHDSGAVIFRISKQNLMKPRVIEVMAALFYGWYVWQDPAHLWDKGNHYTIRMKPRASEETIVSEEESKELVSRIEHCKRFGESIVNPTDLGHTYGKQFRVRGLEWPDVYADVMETLPEVKIPGSDFPIPIKGVDFWHKQKEEGVLNPTIDDPLQIQSRYGECWTLGYASISGEFVFLMLIGRRTAIHGIESELKSGKRIKAGGYTRARIKGGGSSWKEDWRIMPYTLKNTGAFMHIWIHKTATPDVIDSEIVFVPNMNDQLAAKILANATGIPIAAEWMDAIASDAGFTGSGKVVRGIRGRFLGTSRKRLKKLMHKYAREDKLPEPEPVKPEVLKPIMPPSAGIWAQLAMQEFINDVPFKKHGIIIHAQPIHLKDVDVSEAIDGTSERTVVIRKDAVRITVFTYKGPDRGRFEVYQTESLSDDDNPDPTTANPQSGGSNAGSGQPSPGSPTGQAQQVADAVSP